MGKVFCSFKWNDGTEGLIYYFDGDFYSVVGYRGTSIGVRIPSEYDDGVNGLHPVVRIIENSFEEFFNIVDSFYHLYYGHIAKNTKKGQFFGHLGFLSQTPFTVYLAVFLAVVKDSIMTA